MIIFVQRVFSDYRAPFFRACGKAAGGVTVFHHRNRHFHKVKAPTADDIPTRRFENWLPRFLERLGLFFNPRLALAVAQQRAQLVVIEGESNLPNNLLIVPLMWWYRQPYVWFTLGRPTTSGVTWRRRLLWPVVKRMMQRATKIACYSSAGRDYLIGKGLDASRIVVLNNALDPKVVLRQESENRRRATRWVDQHSWQSHLRLTYIGAMAADKRPMLLVEVAAQFQARTGKPIGVIFVGDGPELARCQQRASELRVDAFFAGRIGPAEAGEFIMAGDAVVLPGLGGLAINHAMMLGRPVICGRADGTECDLVVDGETGFYLDPMDQISLLDALIRLSADRNLSEQLGQQARDHVNKTATIDNMVQRILKSDDTAEHEVARAA